MMLCLDVSLHDYLVKRLQRVQLAVAGFVLEKYASPCTGCSDSWLATN